MNLIYTIFSSTYKVSLSLRYDYGTNSRTNLINILFLVFLFLNFSFEKYSCGVYSLRVEGCYIHSLSGTTSVNDMAWVWEDQCLDRIRMDGCSESPNEISDTRARSWWHVRASCDGPRHPETQNGVKTYEPCQWGSRWQDEMRRCIERPWPRARKDQAERLGLV